MSLDQLRKRIQELKEKGLLGSGYTAPELPGMGEPYNNQSSADSSRNAVDNTENLGYTPVKTTGNSNAGIASTNVYVPNMGAAPNADTAGSNNNTRNNSTSGNNSIEPYQISDSEKELNYMMDMLFMNGAGSSSVPSVQAAYEWVSNPENKGKEIPQDVLDTYYAFMGGVDDKQIARSNQIAVGKDDEIGLVDEIYENKPRYSATPEVKPVTPVSTDSVSATKQNNNVTTLGKAGQTVLGDIIKPIPDVFGTRSGYLYAAYQAGLNGQDFSRELRDDAAAGNFLDEIEKMYKAGEADAKIAKGDIVVVSDENTVVPNMGAAHNADTLGSYDYTSSKDLVTTKVTSATNDLSGGYQRFSIEQDFNYISDMMFMNGAGSSSDPSVQRAYQYFTNPENKGKKIPEEMIKIYEDYVKTVYGFNGDRSHKIAAGTSQNDSYDERMENIKKRNTNTINPAEEVHVFPVEGGNFKTVDDKLTDYPYYPSGEYHGGTDIKAPKGTPVYASFDGYVVEVVDKFAPGTGTSYGNRIKIKSIYNGEEIIVIYGHFNDIEDWIADAFKTGAIIKAGTIIGYVGNTGYCDPPSYYHLHFEILKSPYSHKKNAVNPLEIVR